MTRYLVVSLCCCVTLLFADDADNEKAQSFEKGDEIIVSLNEGTDSAYKVTAKIVEILSNGTLKISASKSFESPQFIKIWELEGVIDPDDISSENTISSKQVAELLIRNRNISKEQEEQDQLDLPLRVNCTVHMVRGRHQHSLSGKILKINDQWLVLNKGHTLQWIPREAILYVSVKAGD